MHAAGLILHVGAGSVAILAGGAALAVRKGGRPHRLLGTLFFWAMLTMTAMAALLAVSISERGNVIAAGFVAYLVVTARMTVRHEGGATGMPVSGGFLAALALAAAGILSGVQAAASATGRLDHYPAGAYFALACLPALAAALDLNLLLRGRPSQSQRMARHVWRMCTALFFATGSFFIGQQKVMPGFMHGSPILLGLGLAPLPLMIVWLIRVRRGRHGPVGAPRPATEAA